MSGLMQTNLKSLPLVYRGKVRECYAVGQDKLLMIASDRISAFDSILSVPIPNKGKVLTQITQFWFDKLTQGMPNQLTGIDPATVVAPDEVDQVTGRAMVVKRLTPILIECVARGYIIGGGWKDYQATGSVCGIKLPEGLKMAQKLPEPIFTPAAKAEIGTHDENISFEKVVEMYGSDVAQKIRDYTLDLYTRAAEYAATRGIIIATRSLSLALMKTATSASWMKCSRPTARASGRLTSTPSAFRPRATTSSFCVTGSNPRAGTRCRPLRCRPRTSSRKPR